MRKRDNVGWVCFSFFAAHLATGLLAAAPPAEKFSPFLFAVIADPQIGMVAAEQDRVHFAEVVQAINAAKAESRPAFVFIAGDLTHQPANREQMTLFDEVRTTFTMPVYALPGNHDVAADGKRLDPALLDYYRRTIGPDRFAVEQGGCLFIALNSQLWVDGAALAHEQFEWLKGQLGRRKRYRYVFIVQHHPLYLSTVDEKDEYFNTPLPWRLKLLQLFEKEKVTAVLSGHLHRNLSGNYHGIAMLTTPSTCRNFDGSAFGYRLVRVNADGFIEQYVGVSAAK